MQIVKNVLMVIYVVVCLALIIIAMIQSKEDAGLSGNVTNSGNNNFLDKNKGRTKEGMLKRWTIILGTTFAVLSVALGVMYIV